MGSRTLPNLTELPDKGRFLNVGTLNISSTLQSVSIL